MINWIFALIIGLISGALLFLCVWLRGRFVPIAILKIGQSGPIWVWVITILVMIALSNLMLIVLRMFIQSSGLALLRPGQGTLLYEIGFAMISFAFALFLIRRRMCREDCPLSVNGYPKNRQT